MPCFCMQTLIRNTNIGGSVASAMAELAYFIDERFFFSGTKKIQTAVVLI